MPSACSVNPRLSPAARAWAQGPVRWLMLPAEEREFERLQSDAEARLFVEEFWRRRDPAPGSPANPARRTFEDRVKAADRTYVEEGVRGSMTDPGRALILLGPPPLLRYGHRNAPAWRPTASASGPMPVRNLVVESWEYPYSDLDPSLVALLEDKGEPAVVLDFVVTDHHTRLMEGEEFLKLAAQAMVELVPEP